MTIRKRTPEESSKSGSSAAEVIATNDDLVWEILFRLSIKSLLRFKSVSKHWLSLITHPQFIARKSRNPSAVSALYVNCWSRYSEGFPDLKRYREVVPLDDHPSHTRVAALKDISCAYYPEFAIEIVHSCNGLLCCGSSWINGDYFVYNPTAKQFTTLPPIPALRYPRVLEANLAFDPSKSPVYKVVVCFQESGKLPQIVIYSSETRRWRVSGAPFARLLPSDFFNGVYWNGALYWVHQVKPSFYFDLSEEILRELPLPMPPPAVIIYFGESSGHLHLVGYNNNATPTLCTVHEMEADGSGWFVKFTIDFSGMVPAYPSLRFPILLSMVRGEKEEDSFVVMNINGQIVRYNFIRQTHKPIWNIIGYHTKHDSTRTFLTQGSLGPVVFQYIESLSLV